VRQSIAIYDFVCVHITISLSPLPHLPRPGEQFQVIFLNKQMPMRNSCLGQLPKSAKRQVYFEKNHGFKVEMMRLLDYPPPLGRKVFY